MAACSCGAKATDRWTLHLCADGNRKRVLRLCRKCDIALNRHVLTLLGDPRRDAKMARYETKAN